MLKKTGLFINNFFTQGHERTIRAKKNIAASFGIKGLAIIIGLVKIPIILSYLDVEKYGVWLTIASIVDWVQYFDLGIGHGLRNKLAESLAINDKERARKLVSTAYYYISIIFLGLCLVILPLISLLDWQKILNVGSIQNKDLILSVGIVLIMFILRFIFGLITSILKADQRPALSDILMPISSIITLFLVMILGVFSDNSLLLASIVIAIPPTLVMLMANIIFFHKKYKDYRPSLINVEKVLFKDIFSLGMKFFFIQLGSLVMFSSSNLILTQLVNPEEVTIFNVTRQYFSVPMMTFIIIVTPFWSAITDAYTRSETEWIKSIMNKLILISIICCFGIIIMLFISQYAYHIWLGDKLHIPFKVSLFMAIYNIFLVLFTPFTHFINGVGKLKLSMRVVMFKTILFLPIAILLTYQWNTIGLIMALILVNSLPAAYFETVQYLKIINSKAYGIWNK